MTAGFVLFFIGKFVFVMVCCPFFLLFYEMWGFRKQMM